MAERLNLDALEQSLNGVGNVCLPVHATQLLALISCIRDLERASQPGSGEGEERAAFEAAHQHLDLTMAPDAWGRNAYVHSHVGTIWAGWQARAALAGGK